MTCPYASWDGSYVLGALSPAERQEFETHLATCSTCDEAVRALAGLPGLMARVDEVVLVHPPEPEPAPVTLLPATLLPALVREVRRQHQRRRWVVAGLAAASVVVVTAAAATLGGWVGEEPPAAAPDPATSPSGSAETGDLARAMQTVGDAPIAGWLSLESVAWGTRLSLECTYDDPGYSPAGANSYAMVVRTQEGGEQQVATWTAVPGRPIHLEAATATERDDIASVEVRDGSGRTLLRLPG